MYFVLYSARSWYLIALRTLKSQNCGRQGGFAPWNPARNQSLTPSCYYDHFPIVFFPYKTQSSSTKRTLVKMLGQIPCLGSHPASLWNHTISNFCYSSHTVVTPHNFKILLSLPRLFHPTISKFYEPFTWNFF